MKVLIACEYSGTVRDAFIKKGHDAISCDLLPTDSPGPHYTGYIQDVIKEHWDLIIAHPPCTYICNSGVRWLYNKDGSCNCDRWKLLASAIDFFNLFKNVDCKKLCIENPIPHRYAVNGFDLFENYHPGIGRFTQKIQPYEYGHTTSKATCLWLNNLPVLKPTAIIPKEYRTYDIHIAPPGPLRWKQRSKTFQGIADAMANQWG